MRMKFNSSFSFCANFFKNFPNFRSNFIFSMAAPAEKKKKHSSADHRLISAIDTNQQKKQLGSFETEDGERRSVRIGMRKNRRWICNDIWMDTFPHFDRPQLGLKMALLSPRFNALVDKHFGGKSELPIWRPISIRNMAVTKAKLYVEKNAKSVRLPVPNCTMPNKIRFKDLRIDYIDFSVIKFFCANQQVFDKGTNLDLHVPYDCSAKKAQQIWNDFTREIWPIFATNVRHLSFSDSDDVANLRFHTSPSFLSDLDIISIHSDALLPDSIADDGPNATAAQALSKWLNIPTKDGKPKQLSCSGSTSTTNKCVNNFKETFLRATTSSASYIIRFELYNSTEITSFELVNERTNEMLTLEKEKREDESMDEDVDEYFDLVLKRCQIGTTVQWKDKKTDNLNNVKFQLYEFGPLSPPKSGKKNAKNRLKMNPGPSGQRKK